MSATENTRQRVAIYARVSTEEQREGQTIQSQISELERLSRERGWPIIDTYRDDGWSGAILERPDLDRLRDDARQGRFDAVLVNDVDRMARDVTHLGVIKRDLERSGTKLVFRSLPSDASPTYNLMVNILGSFAEFERELIADRTRRGRRHKVEVEKRYLGSNTSYGFRYVPKDHANQREGYLLVVPEEATVVRQMFEWIDNEGLSALRVVRRLNERGFRPRKGAGQWAKSSVLRILRNEMYAGVWYYNKFQGCEPKNPSASPRYRKHHKCSLRQRPKKDWIPLRLPRGLMIVARPRWERVQAQLDKNTAFSPRNEKHSYLLKGLVRCGACGARFVGDPCHGKFYYRCMARCKKIRTIREEVLNAVVQNSVASLMSSPDVILEPLRQLHEANASKITEQKKLARELEQEERRLNEEERRLFEAYRRGIISPTQLGRELEAVSSRRTVMHSVRSKEVNPLMPIDQTETTVNEFCAEVAQKLATFTTDEWRQFLRTLIQTIVFEGECVRIQGRVPIAGQKRSGEGIDFANSCPIRAL